MFLPQPIHQARADQVNTPLSYYHSQYIRLGQIRLTPSVFLPQPIHQARADQVNTPLSCYHSQYIRPGQIRLTPSVFLPQPIHQARADQVNTPLSCYHSQYIRPGQIRLTPSVFLPQPIHQARADQVNTPLSCYHSQFIGQGQIRLTPSVLLPQPGQFRLTPICLLTTAKTSGQGRLGQYQSVFLPQSVHRARAIKYYTPLSSYHNQYIRPVQISLLPLCLLTIADTSGQPRSYWAHVSLYHKQHTMSGQVTAPLSLYSSQNARPDQVRLKPLCLFGTTST